MAMSTGGGPNQPLSEINVTPLVDVMLVLLIIFMVASSVETVRVETELQRLQRETNVEELPPQTETHPSQKVEVELPKVNSDRVNLAEEQKLVLSLNTEMDFFIGETKILSCPQGKGDWSSEAVQAAYKGCLTQLADKLVENQKLQEDGELYLRSDRTIDYGKVLSVMATVRQAGITKFGLVADPDVTP